MILVFYLFTLDDFKDNIRWIKSEFLDDPKRAPQAKGWLVDCCGHEVDENLLPFVDGARCIAKVCFPANAIEHREKVFGASPFQQLCRRYRGSIQVIRTHEAFVTPNARRVSFEHRLEMGIDLIPYQRR